MSKSFFDALDSKTAFGFGLASGLAVMFVIGFFVLLGLYVRGGDTKAAAPTPTAAAPTAAAPTAAAPTPTASAPEIGDDVYAVGPEDAKVTLIEFSDVQCPFCSRFHPTAKQIVQEYPNDVRWVYKHFPLDSIHPQARPGAEAAECLGAQLGDEAFFSYLDALFANQQLLSRDLYIQEAVKLGANQNEFTNCIDNREMQDKVQADYQLGLSSGVTGTPGSFVNDQVVRGALPYEQVKAMVEAELAK